MIDFNFAFIISAFIAGILTFLAPCTLPLVPAYLGFISGVSNEELLNKETKRSAKWKIIRNGFFFVLGFSIIFIIFGVLASSFGRVLVQYQNVITKVGGILIILFGLSMLRIFKLSFLCVEKKFPLPKLFAPGNPISSLVVGIIFGVGWSPCIGPILASILFLAGTQGTILAGTFLLIVYSVGIAIPFLFVAFLAGEATKYITRISGALKWVSAIGGVFLILLGALLVFGNFSILILWGYKLFDFIGYEKLTNLL